MTSFMQNVVLKINNKVVCTGAEKLEETDKGYKCNCTSPDDSLYLQKPDIKQSNAATLDSFANAQYTFIYETKGKSYTVKMHKPHRESHQHSHKMNWKTQFKCNKD